MAITVDTPRTAVMTTTATSTPAPAPRIAPGSASHWRAELPTLAGRTLSLRQLRLSDAPALLATLSVEEVARFISTPPRTAAGFERFIEWTLQARAEGRYVCFAVVPHGMTTPVGIFQVRQLGATFATAEWGFALGADYWGRGYFVEAARLVLDFAFDQVGVERMEARSATPNGRGNGALRKLGAVWEGVLRRSFVKDACQMDQMLWSILADEWREVRSGWTGAVLTH
ncbi:MAG: GNAT family N-acetyltransferase [Vicinamibacterales bacterium]